MFLVLQLLVKIGISPS